MVNAYTRTSLPRREVAHRAEHVGDQFCVLRLMGSRSRVIVVLLRAEIVPEVEAEPTHELGQLCIYGRRSYAEPVRRQRSQAQCEVTMTHSALEGQFWSYHV